LTSKYVLIKKWIQITEDKKGGGGTLEITKEYDPHQAEPKWQKRWEELGIYRFRRDDFETPTYVIDTPPPYSFEGGTERGVSHGHGAQLDLHRHRRAI
jgi:hypothetical protein